MFNLDELLIPVWDSNIIYNESLTFVDNESVLMFEPNEVISLKDSHLASEYIINKDFHIEGRKIRIISERMFSFTSDELYPQKVSEHSFPCKGGNLLFHEGSFFHDRQYAITYHTKNNTWSGHRPSASRSFIPLTMAKLSRGENIAVTLFGDSISVGANSSGFVNCPPYQKPFGDLLCDALNKQFGVQIDFHNSSNGGKDSAWGLETVEKNVNFRKNDLVIIAFGANDADKNSDEFLHNIKGIIERIQYKYPQCEFILIATSLANPLLTTDQAHFYGSQASFSDAMDSLICSGIAKADITKMQKELLRHKRFVDITANNVNHPNDFFHRLYAQYLFSMFR